MQARFLLPLFAGLLCLECTKQETPPDYSHAADFTYTGTLQNSRPITFSSTSPDAKSYNWDFGDGTTKSTDSQPTHKFYKPGTYPVTLTAVSPGGPVTQTQNLIIAEADTVGPFINTITGEYHFTKMTATAYAGSGPSKTQACNLDATVSRSGQELSFSLEYGTLPLRSASALSDYSFGRNYSPYAYLFFKHGTDSLVYSFGTGYQTTIYFGKKK